MAGKTHACAAAVALATTGAFAGGVLFISAVLHPGGMKIGYNSFCKFFQHLYPRALRIQGTFAILGTAAATTAAVASPDKESRVLWCLSTALMAAMAPYTLLVMIPAHNKLMRQDETEESAQATELERWGKAHHVRTVLSMSAFAVMIATVVRGKSSA